MAQFRKKPVVINAMQFETNNDDGSHIAALKAWAVAHGSGNTVSSDGTDVFVETLEGTMRATVGDWIIRGVKGEFYPCKPDIFEATYEPNHDLEAAEAAWESWLEGGRGELNADVWRRVCEEGHGYFTDGYAVGRADERRASEEQIEAVSRNHALAYMRAQASEERERALREAAGDALGVLEDEAASEFFRALGERRAEATGPKEVAARLRALLNPENAGDKEGEA